MFSGSVEDRARVIHHHGVIRLDATFFEPDVDVLGNAHAKRLRPTARRDRPIYRNGAPGPSGIPAKYQRTKKRNQPSIIAIEYGMASAIKVPTPAPL